ncbi:MAG: DUF1273 domain-containing protein [Firmicutes bacterium]|nr:DUF1273 domain-containing protein [Bacillota bacterium]
MRENVCCFTGHRYLPQGRLSDITLQLEAVVEELITRGIIYYGCGGAIGFDQLAGKTVLRLKERFPQIKLIMVLPCMNQDTKWLRADKDRYSALLEACDKKVYVQQEYDNGCMLKRNRHLVDNSGFCVAYLTQPRGGTFYTVGYANRQKVPVINIADRIA